MSGTSTAGNGPRATGDRNRWTVLVVLCLSLLLVALDSTVLHVAIPAVTEDLRPGAVSLLWIVDAYPLVCASLLILFGTLGDRIGRRRVLLCGYALFGAASALAAFADGPGILIAARALLGVGGAMIMPATLSLLRTVFPDRRERATAIGVWTAVAAVGAAVGPVVGGFLVAHFWWGSVFLINIPLMALVLPVGRWLLPESRGAGGGPWDVLGALMAAAGVLGLVLGIKRAGGEGDLLSPAGLVPPVLGALLLVLFVRRQRRRTHPLVDMALFARPAFSTSVGCVVVAMLALVGLELIAVQYLQLVLGLSPLETGLRLLPLTFAAMAAGATGSTVLRRFGPRRMVALGFVLTAAAVLLLTLMGEHDRPVLLTAGFVALGFGLQTTLFGAYESMLNEAPAERAGGAAAIGETSYQLGAGLGIALLGSVMNAAYAPGLAPLHSAAVPAGTADAAARSLGEAYQEAAALGGPAGRLVRATAQHAFVDGLHLTLVVSAGLLLLGALAALRLPRHMEGAGTDAGSPAGDPVPADPPSGAPTAPGSGHASVPAQAPPAGSGGSGARRHPADQRVPAPARRATAEATGSGRTAR
ncbi:MFS transporter [uncultured Streptomyces sp.]|uniref:MFS transporter n=1 Tax=uncultured Streptomyces sp. TaxID=174707 RepID=UPI00263622DE|nr:MFS transporter [uncultured Streptomyces sp.]